VAQACNCRCEPQVLSFLLVLKHFQHLQKKSRAREQLLLLPSSLAPSIHYFTLSRQVCHFQTVHINGILSCSFLCLAFFPPLAVMFLKSVYIVAFFRMSLLFMGD
jgi:hypothetical protein